MNPLDCGLDEYRQITMTQRERIIQRNFQPSYHSANWIVYDHRGDEDMSHISVSQKNQYEFHATVGNQHYGINKHGELWTNTDRDYDYNQSHMFFARRLYEHWRNL